MPVQSPTYTMVPNEFFTMSKLGPHVSCVLFALSRKTFGWHKKMDTISLSQIAEMTGFGKPVIIKALKKLEELEYISVEKEPKKTSKITMLVESCGNPGLPDISETGNPRLPDSDKTGNPGLPTKESILNKSYKETGKNGESIKTACNLFVTLYHTRYKHPPLLTRTEYAIMGKLLKLANIEDVLEKIRLYFNTSYWFNDKEHTIPQFRRHYNAINIKTPPTHTAPPPPAFIPDEWKKIQEEDEKKLAAFHTTKVGKGDDE